MRAILKLLWKENHCSADWFLFYYNLKCCVTGNYIKKIIAWNRFYILCSTKQSTYIRRFTGKEKLMQPSASVQILQPLYNPANQFVHQDNASPLPVQNVSSQSPVSEERD